MNKQNDTDLNKPEASNAEIHTKAKPKTRARKRKRSSSDSSTDLDDVLPDNTLEVEKNLHASAIRNNLDDVSVKRILKKVVTNDHVLALVKIREEEEDSSTDESLGPKLTRAKAKELMKVSPKSAPWNLELTPIKHIPVKTRPEVKALIAQELPEDEDDEEYEPAHDDLPSDDDHTIEGCSDLDSQPRTPATPKGQKKASPKVIKDGPFKVPQDISQVCRKLSMEDEEATIALRTRSKLSLSSTSIEHIESSFKPPDELPLPVVDDLWNDFLKDCLNPAANARHEDDDEADPEYNVAADPDAHEEDEEALENSIIKISKKELSDLVTELFHIIPEEAEAQLDVASELDPNNTEVIPLQRLWEGKQEPPSEEEMVAVSAEPVHDAPNRFSIGKSEPMEISENESADDPGEEYKRQEPVTTSAPTTVMISVQDKQIQLEVTDLGPPPALRKALEHTPQTHHYIKVSEHVVLLPEQRLILQQQLRQHVQLAACNFLQLFVHPVHWAMAPDYKDYLESLNKLTETNPSSIVNVCNLKPAVELIRCWETSFEEDTPENAAMIKFIVDEVEKSRQRTSRHNQYLGDFPEQFLSVVANSPVFLYPYLLPAMPYRTDGLRKRFTYLPSEDMLIATGLEQFWNYVDSNPKIFPKPPRALGQTRWGLARVAGLVAKYMMPWASAKVIASHISVVRKANDRNNPILAYLKNGTITRVKHRLLPFNPKLTLYEQPEHEMPRVWVRYLAKSSNRFKCFYYRPRPSLTKQPEGVEVLTGEIQKTVEKAPLPIGFNQAATNPEAIGSVQPLQQADKFDVHIKPVATCSVLVASNLFSVINTSSGMILMPLQIQTNTVNSLPSTICTTAESVPNIDKTEKEKMQDIGGQRNNEHIQNKNVENIQNENVENIQNKKVVNKQNEDVVNTQNEKVVNAQNAEVNKVKSGSELKKETPKKSLNEEHCECCILLRSICKVRQTTLTEYFRSKQKKEPKCACRDRKYPRATNRLKLFLKFYKLFAKTKLEVLATKIDEAKEQFENELIGNRNCDISKIDDSHDKDLAFAISFQVRLSIRMQIAKNKNTKKKLHTALCRFNPEIGDPIYLAEQVFRVFGTELIDMYKEFVSFLTAEQADKIGMFKDYFIGSCFDSLVMKIEEEVRDAHERCRLLCELRAALMGGAPACRMCVRLLCAARTRPALAQYIFSLFPHRRKDDKNVNNGDTVNNRNTTVQENSSDTSVAMDCDDDYTSRDENFSDTEIVVDIKEPASKRLPFVIVETNGLAEGSDESSDSGDKNEGDTQTTENLNDLVTTMKYEPIDTPEITISQTEVQETSNSTDSMVVVTEEEGIKREPVEWVREEDKLILEMIKQHLSPEERKDKTVLELIEEKDILKDITDHLVDKTAEDVMERILYLLQLAAGEKSDK